MNFYSDLNGDNYDGCPGSTQLSELSTHPQVSISSGVVGCYKSRKRETYEGKKQQQDNVIRSKADSMRTGE